MKNISYGLYSALAAIQQRPFHILEICLLEKRQDKRIQEIINAASASNVVLRFVKKPELESLCDAGNHQGVVVVYKEQQTNREKRR